MSRISTVFGALSWSGSRARQITSVGGFIYKI